MNTVDIFFSLDIESFISFIATRCGMKRIVGGRQRVLDRKKSKGSRSSERQEESNNVIAISILNHIHSSSSYISAKKTSILNLSLFYLNAY